MPLLLWLKSVRKEVSPVLTLPPSVLPNTVFALRPPEVNIDFSNPSSPRLRLLRNTSQPARSAIAAALRPKSKGFSVKPSRMLGSSTGTAGAATGMAGLTAGLGFSVTTGLVAAGAGVGSVVAGAATAGASLGGSTFGASAFGNSGLVSTLGDSAAAAFFWISAIAWLFIARSFFMSSICFSRSAVRSLASFILFSRATASSCNAESLSCKPLFSAAGLDEVASFLDNLTTSRGPVTSGKDLSWTGAAILPAEDCWLAAPSSRAAGVSATVPASLLR